MRLPDMVSVVRAPLITASYNSQDWDWTAATVSPLQPGHVQPLSSSEDVVLQDRTVTRWRLFLLPTADLKATDRVRWDGKDYDVDGEVEVHKLAGRRHHLEAVLVRVGGG